MCVPRPPAPPSSLLPLSNLLSKEVLGAKRYIIFHLSGGRVLLFCLATTVWATTTIMLVEDLKLIPFFHCLHCPKRYSDIRIKTKPWSLSWSGCNCMQYCLAYAVNRAEKPDIYRCLHSNRDRLGFYAEIQIILGTEKHLELYRVSKLALEYTYIFQ